MNTVTAKTRRPVTRARKASKPHVFIRDAFCKRCNTSIANGKNGVICIHCEAIAAGTAAKCGFCQRMRAPTDEVRNVEDMGEIKVCAACAWHIDRYLSHEAIDNR